MAVTPRTVDELRAEVWRRHDAAAADADDRTRTTSERTRLRHRRDTLREVLALMADVR